MPMLRLLLFLLHFILFIICINAQHPPGGCSMQVCEEFCAQWDRPGEYVYYEVVSGTCVDSTQSAADGCPVSCQGKLSANAPTPACDKLLCWAYCDTEAGKVGAHYVLRDGTCELPDAFGTCTAQCDPCNPLPEAAGQLSDCDKENLRRPSIVGDVITNVTATGDGVGDTVTATSAPAAKSDGLSVGAIIAIVLGIIIFLALIAGGVIFFVRYERQKTLEAVSAAKRHSHSSRTSSRSHLSRGASRAQMPPQGYQYDSSSSVYMPASNINGGGGGTPAYYSAVSTVAASNYNASTQYGGGGGGGSGAPQIYSQLAIQPSNAYGTSSYGASSSPSTYGVASSTAASTYGAASSYGPTQSLHYSK